jgi:cobalt-zinc-cadmium efflux system membrane fusion protein
MKSNGLGIGCLVVSIGSLLMSTACHGARADQAAEDPPPAKVTPGADVNLFAVDHPEQFPLATATKRPATSELVVTGSVTPDITRNVPVVSLASGRVTAIHAASAIR